MKVERPDEIALNSVSICDKIKLVRNNLLVTRFISNMECPLRKHPCLWTVAVKERTRLIAQKLAGVLLIFRCRRSRFHQRYLVFASRGIFLERSDHYSICARIV